MAICRLIFFLPPIPPIFSFLFMKTATIRCRVSSPRLGGPAGSGALPLSWGRGGQLCRVEPNRRQGRFQHSHPTVTILQESYRLALRLRHIFCRGEDATSLAAVGTAAPAAPPCVQFPLFLYLRAGIWPHWV